MKKLLTLLALASAMVSHSQAAYTRTYNFPAGGESEQSVTPYNGGFLLSSAYFGNSNGTVENSLRKINVHDSVERTIKFGDEFHFYFHPVVATNGNIFAFGVPTFSNSQEVNIVVMDSLFNIIDQKQLDVPYNIITCRFFPARDGGAIGVVQEVCNESRIIRLDASGNLMWIKCYVGIVVPPGGYDRTIVNSIYLFNGDRYLVTGHLGFGLGTFYFTIDDNGTILRSMVIETFFTGSNSDVMWRSAFDGEKLVALVDNATNGQDTTFIIEVDTALNVLNIERLQFSDSIAQARDIIATPNAFICAFAIGSYPPYTNSRVVIASYDKIAMQPSWTIETHCEGVQEVSYYFFDGALDGNGIPTFVYDYGQIDFAPNGGNNWDNWGYTKVDVATQNGFCDKQVSTSTATDANYALTTYYIDTIAHPAVSVINYPHVTTTVAAGTPTVQCDFTIGIDEHQDETSLRVFPNPTTGEIRFDNFYNVIVSDACDKEVLKKNSTNSIDLGNFPAGIYRVAFYNAEGEPAGCVKVVRAD